MLNTDAKRRIAMIQSPVEQTVSPKPDLLFDVDGVLVYPQFRFRDYLDQNCGITPEMTASFFQAPFLNCVKGKADLHEELSHYLDQWGWHGTAISFIETWMRKDSTPDTVMLELIRSLRSRGFQCHVASVQERHRSEYLRHAIGFDRTFDKTFFSCEIGAAKPDPCFYARIEEQLGRPPEQLLLVDDSLACIEAATISGWQTFHYKGPADQLRLATILSELDVT